MKKDDTFVGEREQLSNKEELSSLNCCADESDIEYVLCPVVWEDKLQPKEFADLAIFYHKLEYYMMSQQARLKSHPIIK
ncbi:MAG: hypothetical protein OQK04_05680 [Kangiellaceae bacterium]|nr:hypothetical protein [Kangiellaceae bacterium]MCW8998185.1 hypothetical protein [Kangiellaceae bacterium]